MVQVTVRSEDIKAAKDAVRGLLEHSDWPMPPLFVVEFLLKEWRRYMTLMHFQYGGGSAEWKNAVSVAEQLLWSVSPKNAADERSVLSSTLPILVAGLRGIVNAGLLDSDALRPFMDHLSQYHIALLNPGKAAELIARSAASGPTAIDKSLARGDTVMVDLRDPKNQELLDILQGGSIETIDV